jgi:hypothetical protein
MAGVTNAEDRNRALSEKLQSRDLNLAALTDRLLEAGNAIEFWRGAAKPHLGSALAMSVLDIGFGLLPIPVPSSIFVFLYERRRFHKYVSEHADHGRPRT